MKSEDLIKLSPEKLRKLSDNELKQVLRDISKLSNGRIRRLLKEEEKDSSFFSPALFRREIRVKSGKISSLYFSTSSKGFDNKSDYINAIKSRLVFLKTYTSTVSDAKKWRNEARSELHVDEKRSFEILDLLAEENEGLRNQIYYNDLVFEFADAVEANNGFDRLSEIARNILNQEPIGPAPKTEEYKPLV